MLLLLRRLGRLLDFFPFLLLCPVLSCPVGFGVLVECVW